jgi:tetratricopeptide (TPR) repeat protein
MRSWYRVNFGLPPGDGFTRGRTEADRAVDLGPDLAQVYEAPAALAFAERNWDEAERLIRKSLALAPNDAVAYNRLGDVMVERGRLDLALENYQRAVQLDPLSPYMVRDVVRLLYRASRFQEVIDAVARYEVVVPDDVRRHVWRAGAWLGLGKKDEAARELKALLPGLLAEENPVTYSAETVLLLRQAGCEPEAGTLADDLARRFPAGSYLQPLLLLARGDLERALPALQALPPSTTDHLFWGVLFDSVRNDPRFLAWVARQPCAAEYRVARETLTRMLRQVEAGP